MTTSGRPCDLRRVIDSSKLIMQTALKIPLLREDLSSTHVGCAVKFTAAGAIGLDKPSAQASITTLGTTTMSVASDADEKETRGYPSAFWIALCGYPLLFGLLCRRRSDRAEGALKLVSTIHAVLSTSLAARDAFDAKWKRCVSLPVLIIYRQTDEFAQPQSHHVAFGEKQCSRGY